MGFEAMMYYCNVSHPEDLYLLEERGSLLWAMEGFFAML